MRMTKILVTIGPSSEVMHILYRMIKEGADGVRINFAHGNVESRIKYVKTVREIEKKLETHIPIIGDIQGPTFRLGDIEEFRVKRNDVIYLVNASKGNAKEKLVPLPNTRLYDSIEEGDIILIEGGRLKFYVERLLEDKIQCKVLNDGVIRSRKTVTIYGKEPDVVPITNKDIKDVEFSVKHGLDYLALSFVRRANDVKLLRDLLSEKGGEEIKIIAKIETKQAVRNLHEIIKVSDAILIARGDLGMYFDLAEIPKIQEYIVRESIKYGKPVILATQILESMVSNPMPMRSEVVDAFNAVKQGVDALLLTSETSIGSYPVEAVKWLRKIIEEGEKDLCLQVEGVNETIYDKFAKGVCLLANSIGAKVIAYTRKGNTARRISRYRIRNPTIVVTNSEKVARQINILWGIRPLYVEASDYNEAWFKAFEKLKSKGIIAYGDIVILTTGLREGATDLVKIEIVR